MAHKQITAKQSRQARSLLKWNVSDVTNKSKMRHQRLDHFERGIIRLTRPEMDQLVKAYMDHGVIFTADHEVMLETSKHSKQRQKLNEEYIVEDLDQLVGLDQVLKEEDVDVLRETEKDIRERANLLVDIGDDDPLNPENL